VKLYATRKRSIPQDNKYQGTIGTRLEDFDANGIVNIAKALRQNESRTETDEKKSIEEIMADMTKERIDIKEKMEKLKGEVEKKDEEFKAFVEKNKQLLKEKGILTESREGNIIVKLEKLGKEFEGYRIYIWYDLIINNVDELVGMIRENKLEDVATRLKIDEKFTKDVLKEHSLDSNPNDRLREIYERAMETGAINRVRVLVLKKYQDQAEKKE